MHFVVLSKTLARSLTRYALVLASSVARIPGNFATLIVCMACAGLSQAQTQTLDRVVAIVDSDVIMASELALRTRSVMAGLQQSNTPMPPEDVIREQILDMLVLENIQLQMARRAEVSVEEAMVENAFARLVADSGLTLDQYLVKIAADGLTERTLKDQLRREITIQRVQRGFVNRRIEVSEHEIDNFMDSPEGKAYLSPEYHLGHILVAVPGSTDENAAAAYQEKALKLRRQLVEGADFQALAVANSNGQNAANGGDLGWRKEAQLPDLFTAELVKLEKGEITEPFRSGAGFHLLKIFDKKGIEKQFVNQTQARHILLKPSEILTDDEAYHQLVDLRTKIIEEGEDFESLAKKYSEDIGTALAGGDLGWSMPGMMVPEFEQVMDATAIDELSQPFRSEFGWHLLRVDGRRKQDMTDRYIRNQAANILRNQRFENELQEWLQEIREDAYVERKISFTDAGEQNVIDVDQ